MSQVDEETGILLQEEVDERDFVGNLPSLIIHTSKVITNNITHTMSPIGSMIASALAYSRKKEFQFYLILEYTYNQHTVITRGEV